MSAKPTLAWACTPFDFPHHRIFTLFWPGASHCMPPYLYTNSFIESLKLKIVRYQLLSMLLKVNVTVLHLWQKKSSQIKFLCNKTSFRPFQKEWQQTVVVFYESTLGWNIYTLHTFGPSKERLRRNHCAQHGPRDQEEREDSIRHHSPGEHSITQPI